MLGLNFNASLKIFRVQLLEPVTCDQTWLLITITFYVLGIGNMCGYLHRQQTELASYRLREEGKKKKTYGRSRHDGYLKKKLGIIA